MSAKIKSINVEINVEAQVLSIEDARELYKVLGEVLNVNSKPKRQLIDERDKAQRRAIDDLPEAARQAKERQPARRDPIYIPYPVYPQPAYPVAPPYRSPFWYGTTTNSSDGIYKGADDSVKSVSASSIRLLGCTVKH